MSSLNYGRLTTICLALGIASALAFNSLGTFKWIAGSVGAAAALTAALAYFYNLWHAEHAQKNQNTQLEDTRVSSPGKADFRHISPSIDLDAHLISLQYHIMRMTNAPRHAFLARSNWECDYPALAQESELVRRVLQIVNRLSDPGSVGTFEFVLSAGGDFTIRPLNRSVQIAEKRAHPAEEELSEKLIEHELKPN